MEPDPRFQEGIDLFNARDYHAAHDAWESIWLERFGDEKDFLHGLILFAVALHHWDRGNQKGARSRYRIATEKLAAYPARYGGVDLENLRRRMAGAMHRVLKEDTLPPFDAKTLPRIRGSR